MCGNYIQNPRALMCDECAQKKKDKYRGETKSRNMSMLRKSMEEICTKHDIARKYIDLALDAIDGDDEFYDNNKHQLAPAVAWCLLLNALKESNVAECCTFLHKVARREVGVRAFNRCMKLNQVSLSCLQLSIPNRWFIAMHFDSDDIAMANKILPFFFEKYQGKSYRTIAAASVVAVAVARKKYKWGLMTLTHSIGLMARVAPQVLENMALHDESFQEGMRLLEGPLDESMAVSGGA